MADIVATYENQFPRPYRSDWAANYRVRVEQARTVTEQVFRSQDFQRQLWDAAGVSDIKRGNHVIVPGAYTDPAIIDALWALREWHAPADAGQVAAHLDAEFSRILDLVTPRHNIKRPLGRLQRIFATLRVHEVSTLLGYARVNQFREWVGQEGDGLGLMGQNAMGRRAVRDALGPDDTVAKAIEYNQFIWFVWEELIKPTSTGPKVPAVEGDPQDDPEPTPWLDVLAPTSQRRGLPYTANNLGLLVSMLRVAENGVEKADLANHVAEFSPTLKQSSQNSSISQAVALGLLSIDRGTYKPTEAGRRILAGEQPAEILLPILVRDVFGVALILRDLADRGPQTRGAIADRSTSYYPNWTSDFASNSLVAWLRDLAVVTVEGKGRPAVVQLTEAGQHWAAGLPPDLPVFLPEPPGEDQEDDPTEPPALVPAGIDAITARFSADPALQRLIFDDNQIPLLHAALHGAGRKRFVLLAGLSGTGKTSLARAYAQAYCEALGLPPAAHYTQVAVWPDWTDPTGLLGFINPLQEPPIFRETPALRLLLNAYANPTQPFFLCLDEMNLARVEHYFAPFLSAMEGQGGRLAIHAADEVIDKVPPSIPWPANLFIIGTVNMDETTHPFSDKVLDRAFTFEFWQADLDAWRQRVDPSTDPVMLATVFDVLKRLYEALLPARRHFGYRTCDEVLGFCTAASLDLTRALDAAVFAKVLPKIRGEAGGALATALAGAQAVCQEAGLTQSADKLGRMQATLSEVGVVRFWA